MRSPIILLLALLIFSLSCSSEQKGVSADSSASAPATQSVAQADKYETTKKVDAAEARTTTAETFAKTQQQVSLSDVDKAESIAEAFDRKIIRNADVTLEVASTSEAQNRVTSIAERSQSTFTLQNRCWSSSAQAALTELCAMLSQRVQKSHPA